jgi:ADP-ribosylglycohydrolase
MIGSIIGDICGYPYQSWLMTYLDMNTPIINYSCRPTDDTVLTIAVADTLLADAGRLGWLSYRDNYLKWFNKYPDAGYGPGFYEWASGGGTGGTTAKSNGNGAAMRISPVGWLIDADESSWFHIPATEPTHDTEESRRGAYNISHPISCYQHGWWHTKEELKQWSTEEYKDVDIKIGASIEEMLHWDKTTCRCDVTVPQAINCFLLSDNYEDCIRKSLYSQGDVDTIACMAGGIAEAYYWKTTGQLPIPKKLYRFAMEKLPVDMKEVYYKFRDKYNLPKYD